LFFSCSVFFFFSIYYLKTLMLLSDELQTEQIQAAGLDSWKSTRGRGDISIYNGSGLIMISSATLYHHSHIFERDLIFCLLQLLFIFVWKISNNNT